MIVVTGNSKTLSGLTAVTKRTDKSVRDTMAFLEEKNTVVNFMSGKRAIGYAVAFETEDNLPSDTVQHRNVTDFSLRFDDLLKNYWKRNKEFHPFFLKGEKILFIPPERYELIAGHERIYSPRIQNGEQLSLSYKVSHLSNLSDLTPEDFEGTPRSIIPVYKGDQLMAYAMPADIIAQMGFGKNTLTLGQIREEEGFIGVVNPRALRKKPIGFVSPDKFEEYFEFTGQTRLDIAQNAAREAELAVQSALKKLNVTLQTMNNKQALGTRQITIGEDQFAITLGLFDEKINVKGLTDSEFADVAYIKALPVDSDFREKNDLSFEAKKVLSNAFGRAKAGQKAFVKMSSGAVFRIEKMPDVNRLDL